MTGSSTVHIVLVGLMGSGKSSVGRRVADHLQRPFVDTDAHIERRAGRTIREIFATDGEGAFRDLETAVLTEVLCASEATVIATGGGIVTREINRDLLTRDRTDESSAPPRVVWLRASVDTLTSRLRSGAARRPLLDGDVRGRLLELDEERRDLYRAVASEIVDVDDRSLDEVVDEVLTVTEIR